MDAPLNLEGLSQSIKLASELSQYNFSKIYSSPLRRAYSTALEIQKLQSSAPIVVIEEFRERSLGEFEGLEKNKDNYQRMMKSNTIEPIGKLKQRLRKAISYIAKDEVAIIVSHSAVFRCLIGELGYHSSPAVDRLENCQYVQLLRPEEEPIHLTGPLHDRVWE